MQHTGGGEEEPSQERDGEGDSDTYRWNNGVCQADGQIMREIKSKEEKKVDWKGGDEKVELRVAGQSVHASDMSLI